MMFPNKKYSIILADPPWSYNNKTIRGGAEHHYETMALKDIQELPVQDISEDNSILFMWGTWPLLKECISTIEAWGFQYKTIGFVWVKLNKDGSPFTGTGHYTRANTEYCLIGKRGKGVERFDNCIHSVVYDARQKHSKKTPKVYERIEQLYGPERSIELFGRGNARSGWDIWGLEANV